MHTSPLPYSRTVLSPQKEAPYLLIDTSVPPDAHPLAATALLSVHLPLLSNATSVQAQVSMMVPMVLGLYIGSELLRHGTSVFSF